MIQPVQIDHQALQWFLDHNYLFLAKAQIETTNGGVIRVEDMVIHVWPRVSRLKLGSALAPLRVQTSSIRVYFSRNVVGIVSDYNHFTLYSPVGSSFEAVNRVQGPVCSPLMFFCDADLCFNGCRVIDWFKNNQDDVSLPVPCFHSAAQFVTVFRHELGP